MIPFVSLHEKRHIEQIEEIKQELALIQNSLGSIIIRARISSFEPETVNLAPAALLNVLMIDRCWIGVLVHYPTPFLF